MDTKAYRRLTRQPQGRKRVRILIATYLSVWASVAAAAADSAPAGTVWYIGDGAVPPPLYPSASAAMEADRQRWSKQWAAQGCWPPIVVNAEFENVVQISPTQWTFDIVDKGTCGITRRNEAVIAV